MNKLYALLLSVFLLTSCANGLYIATTPTPYYVTSESTSLFTSIKPDAAPARTANRDEQFSVVGHKSPNWLVVKQDKVLYYVQATTLSTTRYEQTASTATPAPATSSGTGSSYRSIQTGPRGGHYYINSNGNKTYVKHK